MLGLKTINFVEAEISSSQMYQLLNQVRAGLRPAHAWLLKIDPVRIVGMRVCVSALEAIND